MGASSTRSLNRRPLSEINITPLVDVMLVLLVIFMVTAPMLQQGLDVALPETKNTGVAVSEEPFVILIKQNRSILLGETQVPMSQVSNKLKAIFKTRAQKQVYLRADKSVEYGFVAEIMGEIRAAGIHNIGLITLPKSL